MRAHRFRPADPHCDGTHATLVTGLSGCAGDWLSRSRFNGLTQRLTSLKAIWCCGTLSRKLPDAPLHIHSQFGKHVGELAPELRLADCAAERTALHLARTSVHKESDHERASHCQTGSDIVGQARDLEIASATSGVKSAVLDDSVLERMSLSSIVTSSVKVLSENITKCRLHTRQLYIRSSISDEASCTFSGHARMTHSLLSVLAGSSQQQTLNLKSSNPSENHPHRRCPARRRPIPPGHLGLTSLPEFPVPGSAWAHGQAYCHACWASVAAQLLKTLQYSAH